MFSGKSQGQISTSLKNIEVFLWSLQFFSGRRSFSWFLAGGGDFRRGGGGFTGGDLGGGRVIFFLIFEAA